MVAHTVAYMAGHTVASAPVPSAAAVIAAIVAAGVGRRIAIVAACVASIACVASAAAAIACVAAIA
jgi:hypothetical protein